MSKRDTESARTFIRSQTEPTPAVRGSEAAQCRLGDVIDLAAYRAESEYQRAWTNIERKLEAAAEWSVAHPNATRADLLELLNSAEYADAREGVLIARDAGVKLW